MRPLSVACVCLIAATTAVAQNLVTNGSFNGSLAEWQYDTNVSYDPTFDATGTSGSGSAKALAPSASGVLGVSQCIAVSGQTQYKAGGKIFIPPGQATTGAVDFYLEFFSSTDCSSGYLGVTLSPDVTSPTGWLGSDTGFLTLPASTKSVTIGGELANTSAAGSASFQANFDEIYLVAGGGASYARWIPAVIHKDVTSKNAKWRSDVAVLNRSSSAANLTITMYPAAGAVSRTTQVGGQSQFLQPDIAGWLGVTTDSGPLEVTSDREFFLSGRTYNQVDATHTYGQDYDGQEPSELLAAQQSAWLPQLTENALYRTNIGITNTGTTTANVTVTGYDASGNQVWTDSRDYAAGGFYQYQQPYLAYGGIGSGYAKVTVNSGSGVVAYASVVDANTGDPTTITMKR